MWKLTAMAVVIKENKIVLVYLSTKIIKFNNIIIKKFK